jgi:hypothetical protein
MKIRSISGSRCTSWLIRTFAKTPPARATFRIPVFRAQCPTYLHATSSKCRWMLAARSSRVQSGGKAPLQALNGAAEHRAALVHQGPIDLVDEVPEDRDVPGFPVGCEPVIFPSCRMALKPHMWVT